MSQRSGANKSVISSGGVFNLRDRETTPPPSSTHHAILTTLPLLFLWKYSTTMDPLHYSNIRGVNRRSVYGDFVRQKRFLTFVCVTLTHTTTQSKPVYTQLYTLENNRTRNVSSCYNCPLSQCAVSSSPINVPQSLHCSTNNVGCSTVRKKCNRPNLTVIFKLIYPEDIKDNIG